MARPRNEATHQDPASGHAASEQHEIRRDQDHRNQESPRSAGSEAAAPARRSPAPPAIETTVNNEQKLEQMRFLLQFAPWEEIWKQTSPQEVAAKLDELELPTGLEKVWRGWLTATGVLGDS